MRGTRAFEIYNNTFETSSSYSETRHLFLRAGTGVVYDNVFDSSGNAYTSAAIDLADYRAATGTGKDSCDPDCSTSGLCFGTYYKLPVSSVSGFTTGDVVTGDTSGASGTILGLGATQLYFMTISSGPFQNGEDLQVSGSTEGTASAASSQVNGEGHACCDQIGRGQNQASEPCYFWDNVDHNTNSVIPNVSDYTAAGYITLNTDYYNSEKSGYTPYTYPHPLRGESSATIQGITIQ